MTTADSSALRDSDEDAEPTQQPRRERKHLYEIDVVRILTFLCVIGVHTTSHTAGSSDVGWYVWLDLLHFTRNVFFALTTFVLIYSYDHKPVPMRRFWPRRFLLVGVPYVAWSLIYVVADYLHHPSGTVGDLAVTFVVDTVTGVAWYHLYFLLVTMQVYLLVPVIIWLVRKTWGHHLALLVVLGVVQVGLAGVYFYFPGWVGALHDYDKQVFFSYLFFIVGGAVAADHRDTFLPWVRTHRPLIALIVLGGLIVQVGVFAANLAGGRSLYGAGAPLQASTVIWGVCVGLGFLALGSWWDEHRRPDGIGTRFVTLASDRSFGIFLSHPMVLWILLWVGGDWLEKVVPTPWLTLVAYPCVILGAIIITEVARRTPLSLALTGRPFREKARAK